MMETGYEDFEETHVWLDLLPRDICERISASIADNRLESRLHLAEISNKQRCAVLASLSHVLELCSRDQATVRRWADVCGHDIVKLRIYGLPASHGSRRLLLSPCLRSVSIVFSPEYLLALSHSPSLRELQLSFERDAIHDDDTLELLYDTLRTLKLTTLAVKCCRCFEPCKIMKWLLSAVKRDRFFLRELEAFDIKCAELPHLFPFVAELPNLRQLSINIWVPNEYVPMVQQLEQVHLDLETDPVAAAFVIGASVKRFRTNSALTAEQVASLETCPFITDLSITLAHGAEQSVVQLRHDLTSLSLRWYHPHFDLRNLDHNHLHLPLQDRYEATKYYMPKSGVVPHMVSHFPSLSHLSLQRMRVAMTELQNLLKFVGSRLESFEASIVDQDETPQERLAMMMEAVGRYNKSIRKFSVPEWAVARHLTPIKARELGQKLVAAYSFLRSRAPFCDTYALERYMETEQMERSRSR